MNEEGAFGMVLLCVGAALCTGIPGAQSGDWRLICWSGICLVLGYAVLRWWGY